MITIYQAGPLFTDAEQHWHLALKKKIEESIKTQGHVAKVIWPYELLPGEVETNEVGKGQLIFKTCLDALTSADVVIALLDGVQVDDGTAWEIGYAYALGKPILGIRTDFRQAGEHPGATVNAMVEYSCSNISRTTDCLLNELHKYLSNASG